MFVFGIEEELNVIFYHSYIDASDASVGFSVFDVWFLTATVAMSVERFLSFVIRTSNNENRTSKN